MCHRWLVRPRDHIYSLYHICKCVQSLILVGVFLMSRSYQVILLFIGAAVLGPLGIWHCVKYHAYVPTTLPVLGGFLIAFCEEVFFIPIWGVFYCVRPCVYRFPEAEARRF